MARLIGKYAAYPISWLANRASAGQAVARALPGVSPCAARVTLPGATPPRAAFQRLQSTRGAAEAGVGCMRKVDGGPVLVRPVVGIQPA